jgi:hypothetical protein
MLDAISQLGILMLRLLTGMETDLKLNPTPDFLRRRDTLLWVSL